MSFSFLFLSPTDYLFIFLFKFWSGTTSPTGQNFAYFFGDRPACGELLLAQASSYLPVLFKGQHRASSLSRDLSVGQFPFWWKDGHGSHHDCHVTCHVWWILFSKPFPPSFSVSWFQLCFTFIWTGLSEMSSSLHLVLFLILPSPWSFWNHIYDISLLALHHLLRKKWLPWLTNSISHYKFIPLPLICSSYSITAHHAILFFQVFVMFSPSLSARKTLVNVQNTL